VTVVGWPDGGDRRSAVPREPQRRPRSHRL